ncbi:sensor histidine kinase [Paenibacillus elgii]|uniref:sensor histidine kinase n=1 Tax=Paenibacillus elgii TaxID=189691 RepID=UPI000FDC083B|nr:HAMP domain-containing sensor histidine kinase [Paenibacillus elgii]NEN81156.1 HAMP domain-containing histidine kinase [Paenibacillus elgii]
MSIRLRLTLWYTAILSATLLLLGLGLYLFLHYIYYDNLKSEIQQQAGGVASRIKPQLNTLGQYSLIPNIRDLPKTNNVIYQVTNLVTGEVISLPDAEQTGMKIPDVTDEKVKCILNGQCQFEKVSIQGYSFMVYYVPLVQQYTNNVLGVMQAAYSIEQYESLLALLRLVLTVIGLISVLIAASVGWFLARKALRPIEQVIVATNRIEKGIDLDKRIEYTGPNDEIGELTQTINGMLGRLQNAYTELEEAYGAQRRFVSDASHELRTPLTTIRGNMELLEKMWKQTALTSGEQDNAKMELTLEAMHDISGEAERMSRLVNDLLSLARADAGFQMTKGEVELQPLLDEIARKAQLLPKTAEWIVGQTKAAEGVYVHGNEDYLRQLLFIFLENAFKYTEQGHVRLDTLRHGGQIGIRIEDTGIGMDKSEIPLIFERFYRADPSRGRKSGTGLGLSIAKWIIDEHQGSVEVKTRKDEGTTFIIWLPIAAEWSSKTPQVRDNSLRPRNQV